MYMFQEILENWNVAKTYKVSEVEITKYENKKPNVWIVNEIYVLKRFTNIDLSEKMLEILKNKYLSKSQQIKTICGSYIDWKYPEEFFDYVISSFTMHHFVEDVKIGIYKNIVNTLKPGGICTDA